METTEKLDESLRAAHQLLDTMLAAVPTSACSAASLRRQVLEVERLKRRVDAVELRLLAQASSINIGNATGHPDTASWFAHHTKSDPRRCALDADLAQALTEDGLTRTAGVLESGEISVDHARTIMRSIDDLPDLVTDEQRAVCEAELLRLAFNRSPGQLRFAGRRIVEQVVASLPDVDEHEDDLVESEEERAAKAASFWIKDNEDGTMTGGFTVPWAAGAILGKIIDAMTAPRRTSPEEREGWDNLDRRGRKLYWRNRRGLAFADLLSRLPTDHLNHKVAATLLVTLRLEDLQTHVDATRVGTTDAGGALSAGAARRMACGAGIIPTVLGTESVPIDLGRSTRLFTEHQRLALSTRYSTCAAAGCDRPFAWTEIHHLRPWNADGATDLDNAVPLCGHHHRLIDRADMTNTVGWEGHVATISFHRRT